MVQISFVTDGNALVRRQDLPEVAIGGFDEDNAVISHGWLERDHPDPYCKRREDVKQIGWLNLFWDFASLFQKPRTDAEDESFRIALGNTHVIYSYNHWPVYRLLTKPCCKNKKCTFFDQGLDVLIQTIWNPS